jgi:hypothetical protein
LGGHPRSLRAGDDLCEPLPALGEDRVWDRIFEAVSRAYDGDLQMVDSSSVRVHQHGGNVKKGVRKTRLPPLGTRLEASAWGAREAG